MHSINMFTHLLQRWRGPKAAQCERRLCQMRRPHREAQMFQVPLPLLSLHQQKGAHIGGASLSKICLRRAYLEVSGEGAMVSQLTCEQRSLWSPPLAMNKPAVHECAQESMMHKSHLELPTQRATNVDACSVFESCMACTDSTDGARCCCAPSKKGHKSAEGR
jgi:hypothetical protein